MDGRNILLIVIGCFMCFLMGVLFTIAVTENKYEGYEHIPREVLIAEDLAGYNGETGIFEIYIEGVAMND